MPFGGLVVNRVHPLDGGPPEADVEALAAALGGDAKLAGKVARAYAEERALAERDERGDRAPARRDRRAGPDRHPPARRRRPRRRRPRGDPRPPVRGLMARDSRHDVVIVGGGHNGLVAAAYLARAGRSVLVLERRDHVGGAAVSERPWPGVDARLSRYAYLVSLLPQQIVDELGPAGAARPAADLVLHAAARRPGARRARRRRGPRAHARPSLAAPRPATRRRSRAGSGCTRRAPARPARCGRR